MVSEINSMCQNVMSGYTSLTYYDILWVNGGINASISLIGIYCNVNLTAIKGSVRHQKPKKRTKIMYCGGALTSHIATSTKIWEPWPRVNTFVSFPCRWPTQTLPRQPVSNTRVSLYSGFYSSNIKIPPHSINYYCWIIWQIIKHIFTLSIISRIWLDSGRWNYL